jgi:hypothetical protein
MSDTVSVHSKPIDWPAGTDALHTPRGAEKWLELSSHAILILGSPRSGTSWLAKIFDSHPEVLYRHEPDEVASIPAQAQPTSQLLMLLMERHVRAAAKRPWFRKTWRPYHREILRHALAAGISLAERVQLGKIMGFRLPDMIALASWGRVRAAVKLVNWDGSHIADSIPGTRTICILRHPCGQIASVLQGLAANRFVLNHPAGETVNWLQLGRRLAARNGIGTATFSSLSPAGQHAWEWRAFNEPIADELHRLPNSRVILYEDLCRDPETVTRQLFSFAGLEWNEQTASFLSASTQFDGAAGYYDVFRATRSVTDRWRTTLPQADQEAIRTIIRDSPLATLWPDLSAASQ